MAAGSTRNSVTKRQGPKYWLVPVAVIVVALLAALAVERLYESAHRQHDAANLIAQIEEEVNEQQISEYEAIVEEKVTPEVSGEISESREDLARSMEELAGLSADAEEVGRIRELLDDGEAAIDEELGLIEEGRIEEARAIDEEEVDPAFEDLRDVLERADAGVEDYTRRVSFIADVGGFAVAALAIPLTAWFVRRDRNRRVQQEVLEESEERFRSLVQEGADLILILDAEGTVSYAAPSAERVLGRGAGEIVGRSVFELLSEDEAEARRSIEDVSRGGGGKITRELCARRADGSSVLLEATFSDMTANPGVGGIVVNGRDVTESKEAGEVLRESEERYRALYEDNPSMYFTLDIGGTVLSVNRFGAGQLGYEPAELVGGPVSKVFYEGDRQAAAGHLAECLRSSSRVTTQWEIRKVRKDGSVVWVRENARAVPAPDGKTVVLVNCEDVTERKEAEALLRRQGAAMETAANGIAILDGDGTFTYANEAHAKVYGYGSAEDLVGRKTWRDLYDEGQLARFDRHAMPAIGRQGYWRGEAVGRGEDGSLFPQELSISLLEDGGFVCIVQDVTERKEAEAEIRRLNEELEGRVRVRTAQLRASEARLRALFAAMTDVILVLDSGGRCLEIVPTNPSLQYKPPEEVVGRTLHELFPREKADLFAGRIKEALGTRSTVGLEYDLTIDGREFWFDGTVSPVQEDSVLFVARDVTERKRAEEAVRRSEARHRALVDTAPDAIITMTTDGLVRSYNRGAERIFGYGTEEVIGQPLKMLMPEKLRDRHEKGFRRYLENGERRVIGGGAIELSGLRKSGEEFSLELSLSVMGEEEDALFTGILRDVTERKRAEDDLKSYARKLAQSNGELQSFAYVASHDLQEPLRKVRAFGDRLKSKYSGVLDERARDYLGRMDGATARMQSLIDDLLTLSRITTQARPFAPVGLGEVVREVLSDLEARVEGVGGRVEVGDLPVIEADRMQMRQLFQNLISNALKFHKQGEPPLVKVGGSPSEESTDGVRFGSRVCKIVVEDNGIGLEEEHLQRIFAPFERLHGRAAYEGTGMGLAICRKVVERHGGEIEATGAPGRGAAFVVTLPLEQHGTETGTKGDGAHDYAAASR